MDFTKKTKIENVLKIIQDVFYCFSLFFISEECIHYVTLHCLVVYVLEGITKEFLKIENVLKNQDVFFVVSLCFYFYRMGRISFNASSSGATPSIQATTELLNAKWDSVMGGR